MSQGHSGAVLETSSHPRVSVLICTRNRAESLRAVIAEWAKIKSDIPWEMVIVDNGSSDQTKDIIFECAKNFHVKISYINQQNPGLSIARNSAIEHSHGDVLIFTDDDCYPNGGIIEKAFYAIQEDQLDYVGGMIELYDSRDAPITIKTDKEKLIFARKSYIPPGMIHGACIVFKREVFNIIGTFNTSLGAGTFIGSGEDSEIVCRASMAGLLGGYNPCFSVRHNHGRRKKEQVNKLMKSYERGRGAVYGYMLVHHHRTMIRYINKNFLYGSIIDILKRIYWISRGRFISRLWNISIGFFVGCSRMFIK